MVYKKILIHLLTIIIFNEYYTCNTNFLKKNKTIQIGNFLEEIHSQNEFISFIIKKNFENYIVQNSPFILSKKKSDLLLEGKLLDFKIKSIKNLPFQIIKIIIQISCKDYLNPKNNWKKKFELIEKFTSKNDDFFNNYLLKNKILKKLSIQLYNKIFINLCI